MTSEDRQTTLRLSEEEENFCRSYRGRTASTLIEAAENLEADYGNEVLWITADGGDEAAVKGVVEKVIDKYGKLDCLVNNAQASKSGVMLADHTKDDFDLAVSTRFCS